MNVPWHAIGSVVGTVAPSLASALGTPLAGVAVGAICKALGLSGDATPEAVSAAVVSATPDQTLALKQADDEFLRATMDVAARTDAGQVTLNKAEIESGGWYVAGWRPTVGWICALGVGWEFVAWPAVSNLAHIWRPEVVPAEVNTVALLGLLANMLGFGAFRTVERLNGVARQEINRKPKAAKVTSPAPEPPIFVQRGTDAPTVPLPASPPEPTADKLHDLYTGPGQPVPLPPEPIKPIVLRPPAPRKAFFDGIREPLFSSHFVQHQVDGLNAILDHWDATYSGGDPRFLAYALATTWWETGHAMNPVEEVGRGAGHPYGATGYYGRGLVQITHQENYARLSPVVGVDLVAHPDAALTWPVALPVLFEGMRQGLFTGHKLADFFGTGMDNPVAARAVVNGSDHAEEIAQAHATFLACLPSHNA